MKTEPFWREAAPLEPDDGAPPPPSVDVAIIGAGFTGLSCARRLAAAGRSVAVFDAEAIGDGASARNAGMIGWGHRARHSALAKRYGDAAANEILAEARRSYEYTTGLIREEQIECGFRLTGRYLGAASEKHFRELAGEAENLRRRLGFETHVLSKAEQAAEIATDTYCGGLLFPTHGALHPGQFHAGLLAAARRAGARVMGFAPVTAISPAGDGLALATPKGSVRAREAVFAANGYAGQYTRALAAFEKRLIPLPSYIIATAPLGVERVRALMPGGRSYVDTRSVHSYFRADPAGERILWGGRASLQAITPEAAAPRLRGHMASVFPELRHTPLSHSWSGRIAYTLDVIPHIGRLELGRRDVGALWYAGGYCGSGVAMAPYLGWRMAEKILGAAEGRTGFDATRFDATPGYWGVGPALRVIEAWHRLMDWRAGVKPAR